MPCKGKEWKVWDRIVNAFNNWASAEEETPKPYMALLDGLMLYPFKLRQLILNEKQKQHSLSVYIYLWSSLGCFYKVNLEN